MRWCIGGQAICEERGRGETLIAAMVGRRAVDVQGEGTRGDRDSSDVGKSQKAPLRCSPSPLAPSLLTTTAHRYTTAVNAERCRVVRGGVSAGRRYARRGDKRRQG